MGHPGKVFDMRVRQTVGICYRQLRHHLNVKLYFLAYKASLCASLILQRVQAVTTRGPT